MREVCFGIDVGGTTVKLGLVSQDGELLEKREFPSIRDPDAMMDHIADHMNQVMEHFPDCACVGAGVGVPGPVMEESIVRGCANLGWGDVNVARGLGHRTSLPIRVSNDANLAAMGEMWRGGGQGCKNLVLLTVGTGIGGGIICDGHILSGSMGGGGEVGHIPTSFHPEWRCSCGNYGCLELTASARGIIQAARQFSPFKDQAATTAKDVFDAAQEGNETARQIIHQAGSALGEAAAVLACVLNPELFLIGGGVSAAGHALLDPIENTFREKVFPPCGQARFDKAQLGNNAGIFGGAALFFYQP